VLTGLIDAGEGSSQGVARGIRYLLDQQHDDGTWPTGDWLQAIVPPDTFYILAEAAKHYPLEALAHYLDATP
jgi:Squalene-hopene cyclase C-terminal domain